MLVILSTVACMEVGIRTLSSMITTEGVDLNLYERYVPIQMGLSLLGSYFGLDCVSRSGLDYDGGLFGFG
jgi:hypothetical protein